ncbi:MAG: DUF4932 domain-containing protein [Gemmatimonadota bacterium]|nr:DUF4932 domain-containing protein [Gemmatimonadota bacterium]
MVRYPGWRERWQPVRSARVLTLTALGLGFGGPAHDAVAQEDSSVSGITIEVDERVELMGVLFRLGGRGEYDMTQVPGWADGVDEYFSPHADHAAVEMAKRLAGPYGVGFFVPMNLAVHVTMPPALEERVPLESSGSLHRTWATHPDSTRAFLELARAFARDSRFDRFMDGQRQVVDSTEARLRRLVGDAIDVAWFEGFWGGDAAADFVLVPGLLNGRASYGVDYEGPHEEREFFAITGVTDVDAAGMPVFDPDFAGTIVHEFNHSFVNPLVDRHRAELQEVGEPLYETVAEAMRALRYGSWESMMLESLVRAAVVRYVADHEGEDAAAEESRAQVEAGFVWTPELVDLLQRYEDRRDAYPAMDSFMPAIVAFFRTLIA